MSIRCDKHGDISEDAVLQTEHGIICSKSHEGIFGDAVLMLLSLIILGACLWHGC